MPSWTGLFRPQLSRSWILTHILETTWARDGRTKGSRGRDGGRLFIGSARADSYASNEERKKTRRGRQCSKALAGALSRSEPALATKNGTDKRQETHQRPGEQRGWRRGGSFSVVETRWSRRLKGELVWLKARRKRSEQGLERFFFFLRLSLSLHSLSLFRFKARHVNSLLPPQSPPLPRQSILERKQKRQESSRKERERRGDEFLSSPKFLASRFHNEKD